MDLPRGEGVHHLVLRILLHASVEQRHAIRREDFRLEMVGHLRRGLEIDLLGALDQRIDDVGLTAGIELLANQLVDLVAP